MKDKEGYKWLITSITFAILAAIIAVAIITNNRLEREINSDYIAQIDSLKAEINKYDNTINIYKKEVDSLQIKNFNYSNQIDSLKIVIDSLAAENFRYQYKLGRIKSYVSLVNKNSSQSKFLKGWITRALNE